MPDDVARLVLGTAALGLDYGIPRAGMARPDLVTEAQACALVEAALAAGVRAFDTAPAYGYAEERLGKALAGRGQVWAKVDSVAAASPGGIRRSLETSLERLRRKRLALASWHNWSRELLEDLDFRRAWEELQREDVAEAYGATTYGAEDALAAIRSGLFAVVQIEWNLLNQATLKAAGPAARERGVQLALRSVFLQGVLTPKSASLPAHLRGLEPAVRRASAVACEAGLELPALAVRAALDQPAGFVLIGVDTQAGLQSAVAAAREMPLGSSRLRAIEALDLSENELVDPRSWPAS